MQKKRVSLILISLILCILAIIFFSVNKFSGYVAYDDSNIAHDFCGSIVYEDSSITIPFGCTGATSSGLFYGGTINTSNVVLNCSNNDVNGDGFTPGTFGIRSIADNVIIKKCNIYDFNYNLNLTNSTTVIDSKLDGNFWALTVQAWLTPNKNSTFLNVSFTNSPAKIVISAGANLFVQYYVLVNATDTNGQPINGANIEIYNVSAYASQLTGTSNAQGLAYFNVTDKVLKNAGDGGSKEFVYLVNASAAGSKYGENTTFNVSVNPGIQMVTLNMTISGDTTPPIVTIINPISQNYTVGIIPINFTLNEPGNCTYSLDAGITNITMTANASFTGFNATNASIANGQYVLWAYCNDSSGNPNNTAFVQFNVSVDNNAPQFFYVDADASSYDSPHTQEIGKNVTIAVNVTDNVAVSDVVFNITRPDGTKTSYYYSLGNITNDTGFFYANFVPTAYGIYNYTIWANDTSGNMNETFGNFTAVDMWAPEISNISVQPIILNGPGSIAYLNVSVTDDHSLQAVWAQIELPNGNFANYTMTNGAGNNYYYDYTAPALRGKYTVIFYANDSSGNTADTIDYPYYFYVPPYITTDRKIYSYGQVVNVWGMGFKDTFASIATDIKNGTGSSVPGFPNTTITDGTQHITFNWTVPYNFADGNYTVSAFDSGYPATVYANFEIRAYYKAYQNGTIVIPMDTKQSTNVNDFDFLHAYGLIWRLLNDSIKVDWIMTPPCITMNATNIDGKQNYSEPYCYGFFMIENQSAWSRIATYRAMPDFSGIVVHNLSSEVRIKQTQITQMNKAPRVAMWLKGKAIINQTLDESRIPYTYLNITNVLQGGLNTSSFDIFLVGHYDFLTYVNTSSPATYRNLVKNISAFLQSSGDMHAECVGVDSLDASGLFIGNVTRGPLESGNIKIVNPGFQVTQTHASTTNNYGGLTPTLNITKTQSAVNIFAVDNNWPYSDFSHTVGRNEIVKFISKTISNGYITFAGGHLGQVTKECSCDEDCTSCVRTTTYAIPRNRMIDNAIFFGSYVNDQTPPTIDLTTMIPAPGSNVTQFRNVGLETSVSDNVFTSTLQVWATIDFNSTTQTILMDGPYYPLNYTTAFTNTSYVIDKNTPTRYNITFYANDSNGNVANATSWFYVIPDLVPIWQNNRTSIVATYSPNVNSSFNITWLDDYGVNPSEVKLESNFSGVAQNYSLSLISGNSSNGTYTYQAIMPAGSYYWRALASDNYNQSNTTFIFNFTIAKANPDINLTLNGVQGNITVGVGSVVNITAGLLNGSSGFMSLYDNNSAISSGNNALSNLTQYLGTGTHNITLYYNGSQNYTSGSTTFYVIVSDIIPPSGTILNPANNSISNISVQNFTLNASDNYGLANATLNIYNASGLYNRTTIFFTGSPITSTIGVVVGLIDGVYNWFWEVIDIANNYFSTQTAVGNYTMTIDTTFPLVSIAYPMNTTYNHNVSALNYSVFDNNLQSCWYSLDNGVTNVSIACGNNATGLISNEGSNSWIVWANDSAGHANYSVVNFVVDTIPPNISIINPQNINYNYTQLIINLTNSSDAQAVWWFNGTANLSYSQFVYYNFTDGSHTILAYANDSAGNLNSTSVTFFVDTTHPAVTINSPLNTTYTSNTVPVNLAINESGYCSYSLNSGINNYTLIANASNTGFTGTSPSLANGNYVLWAYCNDSFGNRNDTTNVGFSINVISGGGGGGGGGSCTETSWTCGEWGSCVAGKQTRICNSNCATSRGESQNCTVCVNECPAEARTCNGNVSEGCALIDGCYKLTREDCGLLGGNYLCADGNCILSNSSSGETNETILPAPIVENNHYGVGSGGGNLNWYINEFRPSNHISHGNIPAIVIDAGAGAVVVGAVAGTAWMVWLWILGLFLPFFWIRLKHYSVSIFDMKNNLGLIEKGKVNKKRLAIFLSYLEQHFDKLVFAAKSDEMIKYLVPRGFIEVRLDDPFILTGHFTDKGSANTFKKALRTTINKFGGRKIELITILEKASIIKIWRAWRRNKRSEKELDKLFKKK